jgi:hypothetical protein
MKPVLNSLTVLQENRSLAGTMYLSKVLLENEEVSVLSVLKQKFRAINILNEGIYKSHLVIGLIISSKLENALVIVKYL